MARFSQRLAAGVGLCAAFIMLGGAATVAVADPGRSYSDRGHGSDRGNGGGNARGGSARDNEARGSNDRSGRRGEVGGWKGSADPGVAESPQSRVGSGRVGIAEVTESGPSIAPNSRIASDSDVSSEARTSESIPNVSDAAEAPSGSGSGRADVPSTRFSPPRVTVGNGRDPAIRRGEPEPRWQAPAIQPAPAAPPPPPPAPRAPEAPSSWVKLDPAPPVLTQQLGVAAATDWSNPLWGLAGLLLIPAAGAALGYRQARAAQAADRLRRL